MGFRNRKIKNLAKELKIFISLALKWMPFEERHDHLFQ